MGFLAAAGLGATLLACEQHNLSKPQHQNSGQAQFGIFFGGQVQSRKEIPFVLNPSDQRIGFRVRLPKPLTKNTELRWELSKPGKTSRRKQLPDPDDRVTQLGKAILRQGSQRFEQTLSFEPGDPLGLWNIRVILGTQVLLDRPFTVYDPHRRHAKARAARRPDAGL